MFLVISVHKDQSKGVARYSFDDSVAAMERYNEDTASGEFFSVRLCAVLLQWSNGERIDPLTNSVIVVG